MERFMRKVAITGRALVAAADRQAAVPAVAAATIFCNMVCVPEPMADPLWAERSSVRLEGRLEHRVARVAVDW